MITQLNIRGFKSLADVDVELGQVNVFIGANGSGKTNFLEAIGIISAGIDRNTGEKLGVITLKGLTNRGIREANIEKLSRSSFKISEGASEEGISVIWKSHDKTDKLNVYFDKKTDSGENFETDILSELPGYAIFSANTSALKGIIPDTTQRIPIGLAGGRLAEAVEDLLDIKNEKFGTLDFDELFEILDWVSDIAIVPPNRDLVPAGIPTLRSIIRFTDRWMREDRNQLSAYDASEGALYVLFALVLAMHPESPKIFAIDNFDHAMHPRLARATTRIFSRELLKTDRQALLTTHNPLVLDGLNLSDDRIRLFAVERNSYGATKIYRIQVSEEILQATQQGLSLSNLWIMGRLGGVPDIF
ncbi:MAG TPA: chromosome segregation protein SMC [Desulfobacteraceae bacterium]|nr:chromosome segregation protein SMC [Desulfobacteraceae bacterium]